MNDIKQTTLYNVDIMSRDCVVNTHRNVTIERVVMMRTVWENGDEARRIDVYDVEDPDVELSEREIDIRARVIRDNTSTDNELSDKALNLLSNTWALSVSTYSTTYGEITGIATSLKQCDEALLIYLSMLDLETTNSRLVEYAQYDNTVHFIYINSSFLYITPPR